MKQIRTAKQGREHDSKRGGGGQTWTKTGASLTKQHLFNVFKVEILSLTEAEGWGGIKKEGKMENRTEQDKVEEQGSGE